MVILKIYLSTTVSVKMSRRELLIDLVIDRGVFNSFSHCFTFISETDMGLLERGVSFYSALSELG